MLLPLARVLPSGLNATDSTGPSLARESPTFWPRAATSHSTAPLRASLPLARVLPSGLKATELTLPWLASVAIPRRAAAASMA